MLQGTLVRVGILRRPTGPTGGLRLDAYLMFAEKMKYSDYKALRAEGRVNAGIDNSTALRLIDYLPKRYQYAHNFWSWIWILSIPAAILVSIFWKWWAGLIVIVFVTPTISLNDWTN